ncbi:hypothetical protein ACSNOK_25750 [Streptomyces sp. URMC 126]|uniref:DUF7919 family protein n=1 Tax=Streptomyces sp. URMC 126 TaxID=3423401 RepID=UPI003F1D49DC
MAEYPDLSPFEDAESPLPLRNVGWLGPERGLQRAPSQPSPALLDALREEVRKVRSMTLGLHVCEFCAGKEPAAGSGEIHVYARDGLTYAAPSLLLHYVERHHYAPPEEFVRALTDTELLPWDERARFLYDTLVDTEADPAWRVNALLDLPRWDDERAARAVETAAREEELTFVADHELALALAGLWTGTRPFDAELFRLVGRGVQDGVRNEYRRKGIPFPLP